MLTGPWLIYGANGYTGELVARLAKARGHRPILAGRSAGEVCALADASLSSGASSPSTNRRGWTRGSRA